MCICFPFIQFQRSPTFLFFHPLILPPMTFINKQQNCHSLEHFLNPLRFCSPEVISWLKQIHNKSLQFGCFLCQQTFISYQFPPYISQSPSYKLSFLYLAKLPHNLSPFVKMIYKPPGLPPLWFFIYFYKTPLHIKILI